MKKYLIIGIFILSSCEYSNENHLKKGQEYFDKNLYQNSINEFSQIPESSDYYPEAQSLTSRAEILKLEKAVNSKRLNDSIQASGSETRNDESTNTPPSNSYPYSSKYSSTAVNTVKERVERWSALGYLKIESNYKVYISPELWNSVDITGKQEVASTLLIYTEVFEDRGENSSLDFLDKQTGKAIASWSDWSGFEIR